MVLCPGWLRPQPPFLPLQIRTWRGKPPLITSLLLSQGTHFEMLDKTYGKKSTIYVTKDMYLRSKNREKDNLLLVSTILASSIFSLLHEIDANQVFKVIVNFLDIDFAYRSWWLPFFWRVNTTASCSNRRYFAGKVVLKTISKWFFFFLFLATKLGLLKLPAAIQPRRALGAAAEMALAGSRPLPAKPKTYPGTSDDSWQSLV